jgi:4a-hydroxytetrahydrobiopterin dehydratase
MSVSASDLTAKTCKPCEGGTPPMSDDEINRLLPALDQWERKGNVVTKIFHFKNYYQAMAFVNATAWISHRENHHPDLEVGYNACRVSYTTHAINGLSENDFICAAKIDLLFIAP